MGDGIPIIISMTISMTVNETLLSTTSCAPRLKQFILIWPLVLVIVLTAKKSQKLTFTKPKTIL